MKALNERPRDLEHLRRLVSLGEAPKYLFFWGHQPEPDGSLGRGCLSQWWPVAFAIEGVGYASAEHYMMAEKARLFDDREARAQILAAPDPGAAKNLGRGVRGFDPEAWKAHRSAIVVAGNLGKFGQHPELADYLLTTGDRVLVEASPRDRIWGIGLGQGNDKARDPNQWRGLNLLGFALMEVRERLEAS